MSDGVEGLADLDFATVTPDRFARMVKAYSSRDLRAIVADGPLRARVLAEVFGRMKHQFKPEAAGSLRALIRWEITDGTGARTVYETRLADGICTVSAGRSAARARLTFTLADTDFLRLVSGNVSPVTLFILRRVKISGDLPLAAAMNRYFDIPKP